MRQFDVVELSDRSLAVVLQADLLDSTLTAVVAPLVRTSAIKPAARLHPIIRVDRQDYAVLVDRLAAIRRSTIKKSLMSARDREWDFRRALDLVFVGV